MQAKQKQEAMLNEALSAHNQYYQDKNDASDRQMASESTPQVNVNEESTVPTSHTRSKSKRGKKRMINNTVLNEEDAYKWQTELNFEDQDLHINKGTFILQMQIQNPTSSTRAFYQSLLYFCITFANSN